MGSATAVEYEIEVVLESQDTGICWRLPFNTLKNHGYQFEHNFGHGHHHLSTVMAHIMMRLSD